MSHEDDLIAKCQDAFGLLVTYAPITRRVLANLPKCRVVVRSGLVMIVWIWKAQRNWAFMLPMYLLTVKKRVADHALGFAVGLRPEDSVDEQRCQGAASGITMYQYPSILCWGSVMGLVPLARIARHLAEKG